MAVKMKGSLCSPPALPDWVEIKTGAMIRSAKDSGFFADVIADARCFLNDGYVWDVALAMSCKYWCS